MTIRAGVPSASASPWRRQSKGHVLARARGLVAFFLLGLLGAQPDGGRKLMEDAMVLEIVPYGKVDGGVISFLQKELPGLLPVTVRRGEVRQVPAHAFNAGRGQYLSTAFLDDLAELKSAGVSRLLGVVDLDLYVPRLNFVFGTAYAGEGSCLVALPRLRQEFYGLPADGALFRQRILKEAVHELGHTFHLDHCPDPRCVMYFSNSLADTDRKQPSFCPRCKPFFDR